MLEQWGVDPNPKNQPLERCEDTLEMFPAVPAEDRKTTCATTTTTTSAKEKEKTLVLLRYTIGKQMLAYFFAFRYIIKLYKCQKRQFCLGSITKCHVTRYGGGLQSRAKNKAPFEKTPSCGFFFMGEQWSFLEFRFTCVLGVRQTPKTVCKEWMEYATPALQVVIVPYQLGEHKRVRNRMNSSKRFTVRYIGRLPLLA